ncbi:FadR/GntR family transcriptional regulator [Nocardia sp. NPDC049526]|uniref:FadR/GntR family transcriptional regulator n=1 Tax=Nocardia TaxID=1817 RepID=UPI00378A157D
MNLSDSWAGRQPKTMRIGAAEAVLADLRTDIESGELPVGTKLPAESALAVRYGVSRTVIREALRSSTTLGLTETHTGKGTFVIADRVRSNPVFGSYSAAELREARPHIEVPAAGFAALRRTEDQLARLRLLVDRMRHEQNPAEWVLLDSAFHLAVAEASGNTVFAAVVSEIRDAMAQQSRAINRLTTRQQASDVEHHAIVEAIAGRSYDAAASAMAQHLQIVEDTVATMFTGAGHNDPR